MDDEEAWELEENLSKGRPRRKAKTRWRKIKSNMSAVTGIRRKKTKHTKNTQNTPPPGETKSSLSLTKERRTLNSLRSQSCPDTPVVPPTSTSSNNNNNYASQQTISSPSHIATNTSNTSSYQPNSTNRSPAAASKRISAPNISQPSATAHRTQASRLMDQELGQNRERRGTSNPKGYILCRICESVIPVEVMYIHTQECLEIKKAESKEQDLDRRLFLLESSLQKRIKEQHEKWSQRLQRTKQCHGLIALCTVTREVRNADWEDVASPGLLRGLETTSSTILEHVQDDDLMFENYCRRVQEFTSKKLILIRDVHRRKFKADQSILQSRTDSFAQMPVPTSSAAALAMADDDGGDIYRNIHNNNNHNNHNNNNNNNNHNNPDNIQQQNTSTSTSSSSSSSSTTNERRRKGEASQHHLTQSIAATSSKPIRTHRPHRIKRGFSVGTDIHDAETQEILSKFKRKNVTNKVSMTDFQVLKPISKGAFGKVYLCRRVKFPDDLYAVKVLPKNQVDNKTDVRQVMKERKIMSKLNNPFVVDLIFSFQSELSLFLVMDFMPGGDLFSLLQNVGALAEEPSRFYIAEILHAIRYLHVHGILHRDLKPDNVLIGKDGHIKLTDFGLSERGVRQRRKEIMNPAFGVDTVGLTTSSSLSININNNDDSIGSRNSRISRGGGSGGSDDLHQKFITHQSISFGSDGGSSTGSTRKMSWADVARRGINNRTNSMSIKNIRKVAPLMAGAVVQNQLRSRSRSTLGRDEHSFARSFGVNGVGSGGGSGVGSGGSVERPLSVNLHSISERVEKPSSKPSADSIFAPPSNPPSLPSSFSSSNTTPPSSAFVVTPSSSPISASSLSSEEVLNTMNTRNTMNTTATALTSISMASYSTDQPPIMVRMDSQESNKSGNSSGDQHLSEDDSGRESGGFGFMFPEHHSDLSTESQERERKPRLSSKTLALRQSSHDSSDRDDLDDLSGRSLSVLSTNATNATKQPNNHHQQQQQQHETSDISSSPERVRRSSLQSHRSHRSTTSIDSNISTAQELRMWHHGGTDATAGGTPDYLAPELLEKEENHGPPVDLWAIGVMLYEFLLGAPPFNALTAAGIFDNIRKGEIYWPDDDPENTSDPDYEQMVSDNARDLIESLLTKDPSARMTAEEATKHQFFATIDFETLRANEAPFVPDLEDDMDTSYFDSRELHDLSLFLKEGEEHGGIVSSNSDGVVGHVSSEEFDEASLVNQAVELDMLLNIGPIVVKDTTRRRKSSSDQTEVSFLENELHNFRMGDNEQSSLKQDDDDDDAAMRNRTPLKGDQHETISLPSLSPHGSLRSFGSSSKLPSSPNLSDGSGGTTSTVHRKRLSLSKTTDDMSMSRRDSDKQLDRLLSHERLRESSMSSVGSELSGRSASFIVDFTNSPTGRMHQRDISSSSMASSPLNPHHRNTSSILSHSPSGAGPSSGHRKGGLFLEEDLMLDSTSRSNSRCNSPTPTKVGMAARKFLARSASSTSVDGSGADNEDRGSTNSGIVASSGGGGGGDGVGKSISADNVSSNNRHNRQSVSDENLRRLALGSIADDSFEFENLLRLSELNLLAVADAEKKHGRTQSTSSRSVPSRR